MKVILGILGGLAAVVFFIFRGMNSSMDPLISSSSAVGGRDSTGTQSYEDTSTTSGTNVFMPPQVPERWKCVPFEQVGVIKANHTEEDIKKFIGAENVVHEQVGREWGETIPATIVYPNLSNQLTVEWRDGRPYEVIEKIRFEKKDAKWQTPQGIKVGTTLEELQTINGRDFDFYGFEWDYAGKVDDWRNGNIPKGVVVYLEPDNPKAVFPDLLGDTLFPASHPQASLAKLRVSAVEISMRRGIHF